MGVRPGNMRSPASFRTVVSASASVSPRSTPTRAITPRPIAPTTAPATRTSARVTRWMTVVMGCPRDVGPPWATAPPVPPPAPPAAREDREADNAAPRRCARAGGAKDRRATRPRRAPVAGGPARPAGRRSDRATPAGRRQGASHRPGSRTRRSPRRRRRAASDTRCTADPSRSGRTSRSRRAAPHRARASLPPPRTAPRRCPGSAPAPDTRIASRALRGSASPPTGVAAARRGQARASHGAAYNQRTDGGPWYATDVRRLHSTIGPGLLSLALAAGCRLHPAPPPAAGPSHPGAPTAAAALERLASEVWQEHLAADPIEGTILGYHVRDALMPDDSPEARDAQLRALSSLRARLDREAPAAQRGPDDRVTRALLAGELDATLATAPCRREEWVRDPRDGPQVTYLDLGALQPVATGAQRAALLARWRAMPLALDQQGGNIRRGLAAGKTSAASEVARVVRALNELLLRPDADWPLVADPLARLHVDMAPAGRDQIAAALKSVEAADLRPAVASYLYVVRDEEEPHARADADVGIGHLPGGSACYAALVRAHTSLTLDPRAVL